MCVEGSGEVITREVDINVMKGIIQESSIPVELAFGLNQKVEVTGYANLINLMRTSVEDDLWRIDFNENVCSSGMKITITLPQLDRVIIEGSGDVKGVTPFQSSTLKLHIKGSGSIDLEVSAEDVEVEIDGSGDVKLQGRGEILNVELDGSGNVIAEKLTSKEVTIDSDGSGNVKTSVSDLLDVDLQGSGSVYYTGNPSQIKMNKDGSGEVVKD